MKVELEHMHAHVIWEQYGETLISLSNRLIHSPSLLAVALTVSEGWDTACFWLLSLFVWLASLNINWWYLQFHCILGKANDSPSTARMADKLCKERPWKSLTPAGTLAGCHSADSWLMIPTPTLAINTTGTVKWTGIIQLIYNP